MAQTIQKVLNKFTHSESSERLAYPTLDSKRSYNTFEDMGTENTGPEPEENITVEDVLEKLGGYSWFQLYVTFIVLTSEIPVAAIALTLVFTGSSNVEFRCMRNETDFDIISAQDPQICNRNCTLALDPTKPTTSIVQEWELICDRAWLPDFFTSIQMMGMMTGAMTASQVADAYGRKTVFYSCVGVMGIFGMVSGAVNSMYLFGVTRFLAGLGLGGFYVVYFIYLMEFLTPKWRTLAGCITIWSVGIMLLALLAYLIPSWRYLTGAPCTICIFVLFFCPFAPETPRWLLVKERTLEAQKSLNFIARMNGKPPLEASTVEALQRSVLRERTTESKSGACSWEIYKNSELRNRIVLFAFGWYTVSFVYYSMSFNTKNLSGNPYLNVLYMGLVDLAAFPSGLLFNNWLGRRKTFAGYLLFAAMVLIALLIVDQVFGVVGHGHLISVLSYMGRFGVAGAWGVVTCFTAESFPTTCRSTAMGICTLSDNLGGVIAPQMAYLGSISPPAPFYIFAGLAFAAACSTYLMTETNKKPLANFAAEKVKVKPKDDTRV